MGFLLGSPCSPCCVECPADGKFRTDPKNEGTWVPSGTWRGAGGVTWAFTANPGDDSGETWFFYGSAATSNKDGNASAAEIKDWNNLCNWYSNKTTSPSSRTNLTTVLDKRAARLPPDTAVVHVYSAIETFSPKTIKVIYFWSASLEAPSSITTTASAHDSPGGTVTIDSFIFGTVNNGATLTGDNGLSGNGVINDGAIFNQSTTAGVSSTINNGATFNDSSRNNGEVKNGATFSNSSQNRGVVNGGATFNNTAQNTEGGEVNNGATFNNTAQNSATGTVNNSATFNGSSQNGGIVNGGATFNNSSTQGLAAFVNGGATFNDNSKNFSGGTTGGRVNGGATFNDAACSERTKGSFFNIPCNRQFVAHPTDLPVCNGTAPDGCQNSTDACGCG